MSHPGPRAVEIVLSAAERRALERAVEGVSGRLAERAGIVWACADSLSNAAVAQRFSVGVATVRAWRSRFAARRAETAQYLAMRARIVLACAEGPRTSRSRRSWG